MSLVDTETGEVVTPTLEDLEEIIVRGLETFVEVGDALAQVRDSGLYRAHADTFEAYCTERWGLSRSRAYQLIDASAVSTIVDTAPANEAQARELAPLKDDPAAAEAAMTSAVEAAEAEGRKVTAADVRAAVKDATGPPPVATEPEGTPDTPPSAPPPAPSPDDVWGDIEDSDDEIQAAKRRAVTARLIDRLSKARAELDHVHPDDFTPDQLRHLLHLGGDLPRFVARVKANRTGLRAIDGGAS